MHKSHSIQLGKAFANQAYTFGSHGLNASLPNPNMQGYSEHLRGILHCRTITSLSSGIFFFPSNTHKTELQTQLSWKHVEIRAKQGTGKCYSEEQSLESKYEMFNL